MPRRILEFLLCSFVFCGSAAGQISASLRMVKNQHFAGEPIIAVVTVTNYAGRDLIFQSNGRLPWLGFTLKTMKGDEVPGKPAKMFGPMKIGAGQTLGREVDLSSIFQLSEPGNYSVAAVIRQPGSDLVSTSTNRAFFSQSSSRPYWTQRVGVPGNSSKVLEYRIFRHTGDSTTQLYAQVRNASSGQNIRTFSLGNALSLRKPVATVDRNQRLHVMFMTTPTMWIHSIVDTDARLVSQQIHQRGSQGEPILVTMADGTVNVSNSIPYDPKAAAQERAKARKASDRPSIAF